MIMDFRLAAIECEWDDEFRYAMEKAFLLFCRRVLVRRLRRKKLFKNEHCKLSISVVLPTHSDDDLRRQRWIGDYLNRYFRRLSI